MKQFLHIFKHLFVNILATTALSIFFMCVVALIKNYSLMGLSIPFEILLVNFLAHIGFILLDKINLKYKVLNYVIMLVYLIGIIIVFGFLFNWFAVNEIWIVCIVGAVVFLVAIVVDVIKIEQDAKEINSNLKELQKRKDRENKYE